MKANQNKDVQDVLEKIENINIILWTVIVVSIISLTGVVIDLYKSNKFMRYFSKILIFFGLPSLFLNGIMSYLCYRFIIQVFDLKFLSLAYLVNPFLRYSYLVLIIAVFLFLISVFYFLNLVRLFLYKTKENKTYREHNDLDETGENKVNEFKKVKSKIDIENLEKETIDKEDKNQIITWLSREVEKLESFEDKIKDDRKLPTSIETNINKKDGKDQYKVKCPKCNQIFKVEKINGVKKIKCPKCGKEGILKI
jgi:DNA-directed RNA polymerase subunit RPC12/RpoP